MFRRVAFSLLLVGLVLFAGAALTRAQEDGPMVARADILSIAGVDLGDATFTELEDGRVRVEIEVAGFDPVPGGGDHGVHIHAVGQCTPDFSAAGGHFNPTGNNHGFLSENGPHAGDLPNMHFFADGSGVYEAITDLVTLSPGPRSVFDADGSAIVIHAAPDDYITNPAGNSGDRIGCGVIVPVEDTAEEAAAPAPAPVAPAPAPAAPVPTDVTQARADIFSVTGVDLGDATFTQLEDGRVRVEVQVAGFDPVPGGGDHGIHIHAVGQCTPDFSAAGGHFNPTNASHGLLDPEGPHAGDLPNMHFFADGSGVYEAITDLITLSPGPRSIFDADGSAIVIHAAPDDLVSDPAGNSGDRIGCGVIMPVD
ncbi:MAG: superoxide dismutase family protein [Chloroflexota bacterium]|nr:superoxide dismutase family protein [Chloroflexota bacterium]